MGKWHSVFVGLSLICCCDKDTMMKKSHLKEEEVVLAHSSRGYDLPHQGRHGRRQQRDGGWNRRLANHISSTLRKQQVSK